MKKIEIDISFSRDYLAKNFGVSYGQSYFEDVRTRVETERTVKKGLHERFSDVGLGQPDPEPIMALGYDDTLNTTLMFGGQLRTGGNISWIQPGFVSDEDVLKIKRPDIPDTWPHSQFLEQFDLAEALYGKGCVRPPVAHGILESALDMRSEKFLEDMLLAPQRTEHLLDILTKTVIAMKEFWDVKCFGHIQQGIALGSCSTTMLSAELVRKFLVPRYSRIAKRFGNGFLCSCGLSDQNLENFIAVEGARFIRIGWGTDLDKAAKILKNHHVKASLSVVRAAEFTPEQFEKDILEILTKLRDVEALSILLIHTGISTTDANIRKMVNTILDFARTNNIEMNDTSNCAPNKYGLI